jgi:hypothetical protein
VLRALLQERLPVLRPVTMELPYVLQPVLLLL